jgi:clan AA aspartic protease (TIGR02281 family)
MTTATEPEPLKPEETSGRLMRFTWRVVVGSFVVTGLVAWLLVSHTPASTGGAATRSVASSSTMFYHAKNQMSFQPGGDGRYHIDAEINERPVRFVVDPGSPTVMLSRDDASGAGLDIGKLNFSSKAVTPGGEMRAASVIIPMVTVKQLTLFNVSALIVDGRLPVSIVGLDFLKRFDSYDMQKDEVVLRW